MNDEFGRQLTCHTASMKYKPAKEEVKSLSGLHMIDSLIEKFLLDYTLYIQKVGIENGNKGGLTQKLRRLHATCHYAEKQGIYGVDMKAFECLGDHIKWGQKQETVDRSLFSKKDQLHLDQFLFSYYTGGMTNVDLCYLTWDSAL